MTVLVVHFCEQLWGWVVGKDELLENNSARKSGAGGHAKGGLDIPFYK